MKTRHIGIIEDRVAFRRKEDDCPFGQSTYKPNENTTLHRFGDSFWNGSYEWDFQKRRVYLDEYNAGVAEMVRAPR